MIWARERRRGRNGRAIADTKSAARRSSKRSRRACGFRAIIGSSPLIVARYHGNVHRAFELRPKTILEFMERADAFRRPERFAQALLACEADSRGRTGLENEPYPQRAYLLAARDAAAAVKPAPADIATNSGPKIAEGLHRSRARAIAAVRERFAVDPAEPST